MFLTYGLTLSQLRHYFKEEFGREGLLRLDQDLPRIHQVGHSSFHHTTVDSILAGNRAGPNETEITKDEIIERYCVTRKGAT